MFDYATSVETALKRACGLAAIALTHCVLAQVNPAYYSGGSFSDAFYSALNNGNDGLVLLCDVPSSDYPTILYVPVLSSPFCIVSDSGQFYSLGSALEIHGTWPESTDIVYPLHINDVHLGETLPQMDMFWGPKLSVDRGYVRFTNVTIERCKCWDCSSPNPSGGGFCLVDISGHNTEVVASVYPDRDYLGAVDPFYIPSVDFVDCQFNCVSVDLYGYFGCDTDAGESIFNIADSKVRIHGSGMFVNDDLIQVPIQASRSMLHIEDCDWQYIWCDITQLNSESSGFINFVDSPVGLRTYQEPISNGLMISNSNLSAIGRRAGPLYVKNTLNNMLDVSITNTSLRGAAISGAGAGYFYDSYASDHVMSVTIQNSSLDDVISGTSGASDNYSAGGFVFRHCDTVNLMGLQFNQCQADGDASAGALHLYDIRNTGVYDCVFDGNICNSTVSNFRSAGGVLAHWCRNGSLNGFLRCTFRDNTSYISGGMQSLRSSVGVKNCSFTNNTAICALMYGDPNNHDVNGIMQVDECVFDSALLGIQFYMPGNTSNFVRECLFRGISSCAILGEIFTYNDQAGQQGLVLDGLTVADGSSQNPYVIIQGTGHDVKLHNSIIHNPSGPAGYGSAVFSMQNGEATVTHCHLQAAPTGASSVSDIKYYQTDPVEESGLCSSSSPYWGQLRYDSEDYDAGCLVLYSGVAYSDNDGTPRDIGYMPVYDVQPLSSAPSSSTIPAGVYEITQDETLVRPDLVLSPGVTLKASNGCNFKLRSSPGGSIDMGGEDCPRVLISTPASNQYATLTIGDLMNTTTVDFKCLHIVNQPSDRINLYGLQYPTLIKDNTVWVKGSEACPVYAIDCYKLLIDGFSIGANSGSYFSDFKTLSIANSLADVENCTFKGAGETSTPVSVVSSADVTFTNNTFDQYQEDVVSTNQSDITLEDNDFTNITAHMISGMYGTCNMDHYAYNDFTASSDWYGQLFWTGKLNVDMECGYNRTISPRVSMSYPFFYFNGNWSHPTSTWNKNYWGRSELDNIPCSDVNDFIDGWYDGDPTTKTLMQAAASRNTLTSVTSSARRMMSLSSSILKV